MLHLRVPVSLIALMGGLLAVPAKASDVIAAVRCGQMGYTVIDPIYMGRTMSGFDQWACASASGINLKGPPFPVLICGGMGRCQHVGWTY